jgi:hypothetical protein
VQELIRAAVREKWPVEFVLHGLVRVGEPHVYGVRSGSEQLLIYQTGGASKSGRLPNWRTVLVSEITDLRMLLERPFRPRLSPDRYTGWDEIFEKAV